MRQVRHRSDAEALDAGDPLAPLRDRFVIPDPDRLCLDGNSLGRLSMDVRDALDAAIDDWGGRVVEGWTDWVAMPTRVGDRLAAAALAARPAEVLIADSVTVNLYKLAHAAADHCAGPIVTDADNFPTDRYVLEGVARQRGVLCLSHVDYRSGALLDMATLTRSTDALVIWDLSHSVGARWTSPPPISPWAAPTST